MFLFSTFSLYEDHVAGQEENVFWRHNGVKVFIIYFNLNSDFTTIFYYVHISGRSSKL